MGKSACLYGAEDPRQYAVPLDIFFDYAVAPYPVHLYSHAKCAMDTGADRGTWLDGRSSSSVQFTSSTSFSSPFFNFTEVWFWDRGPFRVGARGLAFGNIILVSGHNSPT